MHQGSISSSPLDQTFRNSTRISDIIDTILKTESDSRNSVLFLDHSDIGRTGVSITHTAGDSTVSDRSVSRAISGEDPLPVTAAQTGLPIDRSEPVDTEHVGDSVLHILGGGHWFLEGWIGDDSVTFLVDSGSSVTAMSDSLCQTLVRAGAPVVALRSTSRTLRGANGTPIGISGCYHCVVSFMGLQT